MGSRPANAERARARRAFALFSLLWLVVGLEPCAVAAASTLGKAETSPVVHCPRCPPATIGAAEREGEQALASAQTAGTVAPAAAAAGHDDCARPDVDCAVAGAPPEDVDPSVQPSGATVYLAAHWGDLAPAAIAGVDPGWRDPSAPVEPAPHRRHLLFGVFLQ